MTSEKTYDHQDRLDALITATGFGPWTQFNPLSNSWAVKTPYSAAWVRRAPGNNVQISALMTPGTATDLTTVGTIPATDADGAGLRPQVTQDLPLTVDQLRNLGGSPTPSEGASVRILTDGTIQCFGVAGAATRAGLNGFYSLDSL